MSAAISNQWQATKGLLTEQAKDVRKELEHEDPDSPTCKDPGKKQSGADNRRRLWGSRLGIGFVFFFTLQDLDPAARVL